MGERASNQALSLARYHAPHDFKIHKKDNNQGGQISTGGNLIKWVNFQLVLTPLQTWRDFSKLIIGTKSRENF